MKTAFVYWNNRIAPVFDTAQHVRLVQIKNKQVVEQKDEALPNDFPALKAERLSELGIETLICGAISRPMQNMIEMRGITLVSFIAGELGEIINAWIDGRLKNDSYAMPGCCGRRNRRGSGGIGGCQGMGCGRGRVMPGGR